MNNKKYAIQFFINSTFQDRTILEKLIRVSDFVSSHLEVVYTNISFCVNEGDKNKTYSFEYSTEVLEKIFQCKHSDITAMSFEKLKKKKYYFDTYVTLEILLSNKEDFPTRIKLIIDPMVQKDFSFNKLIDFVNFMVSLGLELEYGMGLIIDEEKMPNLFLTGIKTPKLSQEEKEITDSLALNIREYKSKVWDIFMFNVIKKNIISSKMFNSINQAINNVMIETSGFYVISLCDDINSFDSDINRYNKDRKKLRNIFSNENRIMYNRY